MMFDVFTEESCLHYVNTVKVLLIFGFIFKVEMFLKLCSSPLVQMR